MLEKLIIGRNIVYYRREKGITQEALSLNLCMSTSYLRRIEHGSANPMVETLSKIADELEVPLVSLLTSIS